MKQTLATGAVLLVMAALIAWMLQRVAEYPGVERSVEGQLPSWFVGDTLSAQPAQPSAERVEKTPEKNPYEDYTLITGMEVKIDEREYKLEPNQILIQVEALPATVTFVLRNRGRVTHDFRVKGHGLDIKAPRFGPRRSQELQVTFEEPGEYEITCPLSNHAERGMRGTLAIQIQG
ncbi:MAG: hypothetical protein ACE5JP_06305 [Candidatus Bipolaricaulia bacterium]